MSMTLGRPDLLWLLALLPLIALAGVWFGVRPGRMTRAVLLLRLAIAGLLVLGLAEPLLAAGGQATSTIFVVDRSRSLATDSQSAANRWIEDALLSAGSGSRAAIVTFAAEPKLAATTTTANQLSDAWTSPDAGAGLNPDYTDLEAALALARALPVGSARRIVLVSDGAENTGRGLDQAAQAALDGTPIDVLPLEGVGAADLRVEGVSVPASSWLGEPVTVLTSVHSGGAGPGRVELWLDGAQAAVDEVELPAGSSSHAFELTDLAAGFHAIEVRVSGPAERDRFVENNVFPASHVVRDQPRILLIAMPNSDAGIIRGALARGGVRVDVIEPLDVPSRLSELSEYDAFVLDNVPASAFTIDQVAALGEATGGLGRGLVVLGGTSSYGPGAYAGSELEDLLPVTVRSTDGRQRQRVALLLVMDKSGSMSYDPLGSVAKIDMAKEAARLAARSLVPGDQIGVIMFNDKQEWVVPFTVLGEDGSAQQMIDEQIAAITSSGGTEILPALAVGLDAIRNTDAEVRHIVLLSDGKSRTGSRDSYQRLIDDARADRTTLSTIATGDDADLELLQFLAAQGGGRYHFTNRPDEIPVLTVEEAESAGSQSVIRGDFRPIQTAPSPILSEFTPAELPNLDGYDFVEAKPDAQVILTSDRDDPVLTKWQFGLGRVVAWTADNGVDLAADWAAWDRADEFWSALVGWTLPDPEQRPLQVSITNDGPESIITVESAGSDGGAPFAATTATITSPTGAVVRDQTMTQSGPGQYQLQVPAPEAGAYRIELSQNRGGEIITELSSFAVPPSPELQPAPGARALLDAIAARTGGRVLSLDDPGQVFAAGASGGTALQDYRPLWYVPLSLALGLFLVEIALRMGLTRAALVKAVAWRPGQP